MNNNNPQVFFNLYPDVDPAKGIPLTGGERFAITLSAAVLSFGFVIGDLTVGGAGLLMLLFASIYPNQKTARRIRTEAKERFPQEDWAEYKILRKINLSLYIPIFWIAIIGINLATFWYLYENLGTPAAAGVAILTAVLVWLMPGMNPLWAHTGKAAQSVPPTQQNYPQPQQFGATQPYDAHNPNPFGPVQAPMQGPAPAPGSAQGNAQTPQQNYPPQ
ncbi:MAG: hemin receptor [Corynebacterium sp.]|nr:hemin receptor [Corynebacterium sp.]